MRRLIDIIELDDNRRLGREGRQELLLEPL